MILRPTDWIFNHQQVVNTPLKRDHIIIKYIITEEVFTNKKILIHITIRKL